MEIKCLECGELVPQTTGKRKKEYCDSTCRTTYWKKQKQKKSGVEARKPGRPQKSPNLAPQIEKAVVSSSLEKSSLKGLTITLPAVAIEGTEITIKSKKPITVVAPRKVLHSNGDKSKEILEPKEGSNAYFLRYGAFYRKDIAK